MRLYPLIDIGLERNMAITIFTDDILPAVPPQIEVTHDLSDALDWADYLALDLPLEETSNLRQVLGIDDIEDLPQESDILISTPIPCGLGTCGACALLGRPSWMRTCIHGPVFRLREFVS
jgi:hypothetical protein